jgi:hypothetical protein
MGSRRWHTHDPAHLYTYHGKMAALISAMDTQLTATGRLDATGAADALEVLGVHVISRVHSDELVGLHRAVIADVPGPRTRPEPAAGSGRSSPNRWFPCYWARSIAGGRSRSTRHRSRPRPTGQAGVPDLARPQVSADVATAPIPKPVVRISTGLASIRHQPSQPGSLAFLFNSDSSRLVS